MKKKIFLIALIPFIVLGQSDGGNDTTAKKIADKFIEIGWKAGLNFD